MPHKGTLFVHRPHTLLTDLSRPAEFLTYFYPETNELVFVPNTPLNQPYWSRAQTLLEEASFLSTLAGMHAARDAEKSASLKKRAGHLEAAARWLLAYGDPERPVAAVQA